MYYRGAFEMKRFFMCAFVVLFSFAASASSLPVSPPSSKGFKEIPNSALRPAHWIQIRNLIAEDVLRKALIDGKKGGVEIRFSDTIPLLDGGSAEGSKIYGEARFGPYPFLGRGAGYKAKCFRRIADINKGRGFIKIDRLFREDLNSERWRDRGSVVIRFILFEERGGKDLSLGSYDIIYPFLRDKKGVFHSIAGVTSGPIVEEADSRRQGRLVISFDTNKLAVGRVEFKGWKSFSFKFSAKHHRVVVNGLLPGIKYFYRIVLNSGFSTPFFEVFAPPLKGDDVVFAFAGDSREGLGGGGESVMGVNASSLSQVLDMARKKGATLLAFGGDLVDGYTTSAADLKEQLLVWKREAADFWGSFPVYTAMGNHEVVLRVFESGGHIPFLMDRWPYNSQSSEFVFASVFNQPGKILKPADTRRPSYRDTVFTVVYGSVELIFFNNNYWFSLAPERFGGSPEGYIFDEQLDWIKARLDEAEADPFVRHVFLVAQEPLFPNGGHVKDTMWYRGDNRVRAYTFKDGKLAPEKKGIIDVRNELLTVAASHSKFRAFLTSDEHCYHRTLITQEVPIGVPAVDDKDGDGVVCAGGDTCSPLHIPRPVWHVTSGGAGAPYYVEERTPWNRYWKSKGGDFYRFIPSGNVVVFRARGSNISMAVYSYDGVELDFVDLTGSVFKKRLDRRGNRAY